MSDASNQIRSDEDLMLAAGRGDIAAFEEIVVRHQKSAWNVAYHFLGDAMEAEDVAQQTFLRLLDAAPRYRPTASFPTYLYQVISRLCIDRVRKHRLVYTDRLPDVLDEAPSPPEAMAQRARERAVRTALASLPAGQRMATVLKYYENLSYREIARAMGTSPKAVERLLARALASLERDLRDELAG